MRIVGIAGALLLAGAYAIVAYRFLPALRLEDARALPSPDLDRDLIAPVALGFTLLAVAAAAGVARGAWSVVVLDAGLALWAAQLWLFLAIGMQRVPWDGRIAIAITAAGASLLGIQRRAPLLAASGPLILAGHLGADVMAALGVPSGLPPWLRLLGFGAMVLFALAVIGPARRRARTRGR